MRRGNGDWEERGGEGKRRTVMVKIFKGVDADFAGGRFSDDEVAAGDVSFCLKNAV